MAYVMVRGCVNHYVLWRITLLTVVVVRCMHCLEYRETFYRIMLVRILLVAKNTH